MNILTGKDVLIGNNLTYFPNDDNFILLGGRYGIVFKGYHYDDLFLMKLCLLWLKTMN